MNLVKLTLRSVLGTMTLVLGASMGTGCINDLIDIGKNASEARDGCVISGCSAELCGEEELASTCEVKPGAECFQDAICERDGGGACGWTQTNALTTCLDNARGGQRQPVADQCIRNVDDACTTDSDCESGGCGGELCFNPAVSGGNSTCDCSAPQGLGGCGCVANKCTWWQ